MTSLRTLSRAARRIAASSVAKLVSQQRPKKRYDASESVRRNIEKKVYISLFKDYMDGVGAGTYYKFPEYNKSNDKKKEMYNFNLNIYMEHNYTNYSDSHVYCCWILFYEEKSKQTTKIENHLTLVNESYQIDPL